MSYILYSPLQPLRVPQLAQHHPQCGHDLEAVNTQRAHLRLPVRPLEREQAARLIGRGQAQACLTQGSEEQDRKHKARRNRLKCAEPYFKTSGHSL